MIHVTDKHLCCGCEACVQTCPKHCISFSEDTEGFRYPSVDKSTCIDCGLCEKVCPVINQAKEQVPLKVFAAKNKVESELLSSSSGGLFIVIARKVIADGGVVFGARFDDDWNVVHSYAETEEDLRPFMTSKYVQSRIGKTYSEAKDFLKAGRQVLFTGTPCQIAGLKRFLRRDYDNLLTVDVICHGVPSPMVWRRYLKEIKDNPSNEMQIRSISFRDKRLGWKKFSFALTLSKATVDGKHNKVSLSHIFREDSYMKLFLRDMILRPSCYQCPAKAGKSQSDLTTADFWKIERFHPEFDDERGVGLLMVNTNKGDSAIDFNAFFLKESSFESAKVSNPVYVKSVIEPPKRNKCFLLFQKTDKSVNDVANQMLRIPLYKRIKRKLKSILKRVNT